MLKTSNVINYIRKIVYDFEKRDIGFMGKLSNQLGDGDYEDSMMRHFFAGKYQFMKDLETWNKQNGIDSTQKTIFPENKKQKMFII